MIRSRRIRAVLALAVLLASASFTAAQQRRDREPNAVYSARRAALAAQVDGPIILWGFTGREEVAQTTIFSQEYDFYYLTGHNEEGAGLIILPAKNNSSADGPNEILFLPPKNPPKRNGMASVNLPPIPTFAPSPASPPSSPFPTCAPSSKISSSLTPFFTQSFPIARNSAASRTKKPSPTGSPSPLPKQN